MILDLVEETSPPASNIEKNGNQLEASSQRLKSDERKGDVASKKNPSKSRSSKAGDIFMFGTEELPNIADLSSDDENDDNNVDEGDDDESAPCSGSKKRKRNRSHDSRALSKRSRIVDISEDDEEGDVLYEGISTTKSGLNKKSNSEDPGLLSDEFDSDGEVTGNEVSLSAEVVSALDEELNLLQESQQSSMEIRRALSNDLGRSDMLETPRQDDLLKFRSVPIASSSVSSTMDSHGANRDESISMSSSKEAKQKITISICGEFGSKKVKVFKSETKLIEIARRLCAALKKERCSMRFEGDLLDLNLTPEQCDIEDEDQVDAVFE